MVWHPTLWEPEHGGFGEVEVAEELQALGGGPAEGGNGAVEIGAEGLDVGGCNLTVRRLMQLR